MLRQDDYQKSHIVLEAWRQTVEYGGHLPAILVMNTLANRFKRGWGGWATILEGIPKYSAEFAQPARSLWPDIWDPNFVRMLHAIDGVFDGSTPDISKGATYWCDLRRVETDFFKEKIMGQPGQYMRVVQQNTLCFFSGDRKLWDDPTHGAGG